MPVCAVCGQPIPTGFRFCGACGAELPATGVPPREVRKTVSLLFCDVSGSTALGERLDPEALRGVMTRYFEEISAVIGRHGGTVEKFIGDAVMAVFGIPRVREDDALRAVRAAAEIRDRMPAVAEQLGVELVWRTGVNTGEVVAGVGQTLVTGDGVNVAARLEQAAAPGEILIGAATLRLVRDAVEVEEVGPLRLKGKSELINAYRLLAVRQSESGVRRDFESSPFVGRDRELRVLRDVFSGTVEGSCHLLTLVGAAGVGKSRLTAQFLDEIGEQATIVQGRCLNYGEGITFFPLIDALTGLGPASESALRLISEGGAVLPSELFVVVRRTLEASAQERPLVVLLDDLQWAESMLLDLIDHVADLSRGVPLLLLCIARPDLLEQRPGWGGGKLNTTTLLLEPLTADQCQLLVAELAAGLDASVRDRVVAASEGNPLFVEEMLSLSHQSHAFAVPPTITAILAARLDQLEDNERAVIERGAVEGQVFHSGAVRALSPPPVRDDVDACLSSLVRKEFVRPQSPELSGELAFRFRHLLIRDAAYDALPKGTRAELHEAFADWLGTHAADLVSLDEVCGWHLEQAVGYRRELGRDSDAALATQAGQRLAGAGLAANSRADFSAAASLLRRALALLPAEHPQRSEVGALAARLALDRGELDATDTLLAEIEEHGETAQSAAVRLMWLQMARPEDAVEFCDQHVAPLLQVAADTADDLGFAMLNLALSYRYWLEAQAVPTQRALREVIDHAQLAGDRALVARGLAEESGVLIYGPANSEELRRGIQERQAFRHLPVIDGSTHTMEAALDRMELRFAAAFQHVEASFQVMDELGMAVQRAAGASEEAAIALAVGDSPRAVRVLREASDVLGGLGERGLRSTVVVNLGAALYADGQATEALRSVSEGEQLSAPYDMVNFAVGYTVRALVHGDAGDLDAAEFAGREAIRYADSTDFPILRAEARAALADALTRRGNATDAEALLLEALALCEAKGDVYMTGMMRAALATLTAG